MAIDQTARDASPTGGRLPPRVSEFVFGLRERDVPSAALDAAALLFLDTIGICAAAAPMDAGRIARDAAAALFAAGSPDVSARLLFDGRRVSLPGAVYAAATQIDNLDGHDGYNPTLGHIGVVAAPALVAFAEARPELSGRDALTALVMGYELSGRAAIALHATVADYHTSGAWNALGVAAMAARLRGRSPEELRQALGIAEYHGPRSQMMREIATPTMLHDGSGWGALAGATAMLLAERGFTGAPAITVEADEVAEHWADLGAFWQIEHQYIKPYPTCRWAHAAIDAAAELAARHGVRADGSADIGSADIGSADTGIAEIRIRSFDRAVALFGGMPSTTSEAQYSLPFAVAAQLVHGRIGLEQISGPGLADPEVARLVARTTMQADPRHQARYPAERWADVTFVLADGREVASGDVHARGGPERPFSRDEIIAKFHEFADPVLGRSRADALCGAILSLAQPNARFADAARLLHEPV